MGKSLENYLRAMAETVKSMDSVQEVAKTSSRHVVDDIKAEYRGTMDTFFAALPPHFQELLMTFHEQIMERVDYIESKR